MKFPCSKSVVIHAPEPADGSHPRLKTFDHKELLYFGGGSVSTVKRSRTRTRAMMTAISDKLKTVEKVFVVGHKNLDMDALGATVGMAHFASQIVRKS